MKGEWFNIPEELKTFYSESNHWTELLEKGFAKMNFSYTAELILCHELRDEFYNFLETITKDFPSNTTLEDILLVLRENHISPQDIFSNKTINEKNFDISPKTVSYLFPSIVTSLGVTTPSCHIVLKSDETKISMIRDYLIKCGFFVDQRHAVQKTLEPFMTAFQYEITENFD